MRSRVPILILVLGLSVATSATAAETLLVFPIENRGAKLSSQSLTQLQDYLASKLAEAGGYRLIPFAAAPDGSPCLDRPCQQALGRKLRAHVQATARLGQLGGLCILTASLYRADEAVAYRTATERGSCAPEALLSSLDVLAVKLTARRIKARPVPPDLIPPGPGAAPPPGPAPATPPPAPEAPPPIAPEAPLPIAPEAPPTPHVPDETGPETAAPSQDGSGTDAKQGPRRFLSLSLIYSSDHERGSDAYPGSEARSGFSGARASFDWLLGDRFSLGIGFTGLVGKPASIAEVSARFGVAFRLASSFTLLAMTEGGLSALTPEEDDTMTGVYAGLGVAGQWMFSSHFGLLSELGVGMQVIEDKTREQSESLFLWRWQASLGLVVGW